MKQTKSCWGAPIHSWKCILETIRTLELGKHLLARGESDGNWWISPAEIRFLHKETHMKQIESCQEAPIHSRKCILETITTLELDKHLLEENLMVING